MFFPVSLGWQINNDKSPYCDPGLSKTKKSISAVFRLMARRTELGELGDRHSHNLFRSLSGGVGAAIFGRPHFS